ncbi:MAG: N-6 DNA methylase [Candidatus Cloacimonetes bacterium]|nr:N-6 DNA methylase [Candidatus Cloacimonadota bacterium]
MDSLFRKLGFNRDNGLYITSENRWAGLFAKRVEEFFEGVYKPDAFFCISNKPLILFYQNPEDRNAIFKSVWNFNESPIVFIIEPGNIDIYNGFRYLLNARTLSPLSSDNIDDFEYFNLLNGIPWENYKQEFAHKERVDYKLLENIKAAREILRSNYNIEKSLANRLIGKCIFTRYLIDRRVRFNFQAESIEFEYLNNDEFAALLRNRELVISFFDFLEGKFNGDLFSIKCDEYESVTEEAFVVLAELIQGSELGTETSQLSLFDIYDFSIIPVEFISNVYELFIGEEEQAKKGAYYTPIFLVDYILSQTVEKFFQDKPEEYNCKILDPACGSGIFLVEAYRKIVKQFEHLNPGVIKGSEEYKEALIRLAKDNLFGIDKDPDAVSVSAFSIYLTMLHFQLSPDIEHFRFPELKNSNFFVGDFFDEAFNNNTHLIGLNFIIGNPPWKRGTEGNREALHVEYVNKRRIREESNIVISNKEIAQVFLLRTSDFCDNHTKCALIVTSKVLYNLKGENFRNYFLENYFVSMVFELSSVRREVFDKSNDPSIAPATILFYKYANGENTDQNIIHHLALKPSRLFTYHKIFSILRNDYKRVVQKRLKNYDYLWKILVYGCYLDFNFIKRLKENYKSIKSTFQENDVIKGEGVIVGKSGRYDASDYQGMIMIKPDETIIENHFIEMNEDSKFECVTLHRKRNRALFSAPVLLISRGVNKFIKPKSAILYQDAVYTHMFTGIRASSIEYLRNLNAIFNSSITSYLLFQLGSSTGIEREQIHDEEKWMLPFFEKAEIAELVEIIENLKRSYYSATNLFLSADLLQLENQIELESKALDELVQREFELSEEEKSLIDYTNDITIPLIMRHHSDNSREIMPLTSESDMIQDYIKVFRDRFENTFLNMGLHFNIEIFHSSALIGIFFKSELSEKKVIMEDVTGNTIIEKIAALGIEKISERLILKRDIRGFETDGFYIIKPNEKRLWHKAIAYFDMYEVADAILTAGRNSFHV